VPEAGPTFEGQLPLEPTLRTGRGGTLGIGLFWSVISRSVVFYVRVAPSLYQASIAQFEH
jgi:hypothetical protein